MSRVGPLAGLAVSGASTGRGRASPTGAAPCAAIPSSARACLDLLHTRFVDQAPAQVHATLLDEGTYLCSPRTMYRLLDAAHEIKERRDQVRRPHYAAPELLATRPNEVWSWDITKLLGPAKWTYFYLYVILDIFSRYVVGWMLASTGRVDQPAREEIDRSDAPGSTIAVSHDLRGDRISDSLDWANSLIIRTAATLITTPSVSQCH